MTNLILHFLQKELPRFSIFFYSEAAVSRELRLTLHRSFEVSLSSSFFLSCFTFFWLCIILSSVFESNEYNLSWFSDCLMNDLCYRRFGGLFLRPYTFQPLVSYIPLSYQVAFSLITPLGILTMLRWLEWKFLSLLLFFCTNRHHPSDDILEPNTPSTI